MSQVNAMVIVCPGCQRKFKWREALAGKAVKCPCGTTFPASASASASSASAPPVKPKQAGSDDGTFEVATPLSAPRPRSARALPTSHLVGGRSAIEKALSDGKFDAQPERWRDQYLPLGVLVVGLALQCLAWLYWSERSSTGLMKAGVALAAQVVILTPVMVFSLMLIARWMDLSLGALSVVTFKSATLCLGAVGLADAVFMAYMLNAGFDIWMPVIGYGFYIILAGLPLGLMLEMNIYETALAIFLNFMPRLAAVCLILVAFGPHTN